MVLLEIIFISLRLLFAYYIYNDVTLAISVKWTGGFCTEKLSDKIKKIIKYD